MSAPAAATAAGRAGHAQPLRLPPAPRRVSGPARHPRATPAPPPAASTNPLLRLIDHPWLERLVRGRAWIAIVATALLGIVAMQVALLRLGAQIGSETQAVNTLSAQNETAQTRIAVLEGEHALSDGTGGGRSGMVYPAPGAVTYLQVNPGDGARAAATMTAPSRAAVAATLANAQAAATAPATTSASSTVAAAGGTATTGASATGAAGAAGNPASPTTTGGGAASSTTTGAASTGSATGTAAGTATATSTTTAATGPGTSSSTTSPASSTAGTGAASSATTTNVAPATTSAGAVTAPTTTGAGG
jgi:hypothetical protein